MNGGYYPRQYICERQNGREEDCGLRRDTYGVWVLVNMIWQKEEERGIKNVHKRY